MASVNLAILDAAYEDGFIRSINSKEILYLHPSVVTANEIFVVLGQDPLDIQQILYRIKLSENTLKIYLRWLHEKRLIRIEQDGSANLYSRRCK